MLTEEQIPAVTAQAGYEFTGWSSSVNNVTVESAITQDVTFTAQYQDASYTMTLPTVAGISYEVDGASQGEGGTYTVTHGTDVSVTVRVTGNVHVTGVSYQVGGGEAVTVSAGEDGSYQFTIAGDNITGSVSVAIQSNATYQVTVTVVGGSGTVNGSQSASVTFDANTDAEEVAKAFEIVAAPGYTFTAPTYEAVTSDKTYTLTFTHATYPVTWPDGVTGGAANATHGTDLTFTPSVSGQVVTGVTCTINGNNVELVKNDNGSYTIPGDAIVGNVTIAYTTQAATWTMIAETNYAAAPAGKNIAVLTASRLAEEQTYALTGYGNMFWSEKYSAYVCFVNASERNETLSAKLIVVNNAAIEIDYSGDINGDGKVTPADSAAINAALHGISVEYDVSDRMRFMFDVTGDKTVTAQDIKTILDTYTGYTPESGDEA